MAQDSTVAQCTGVRVSAVPFAIDLDGVLWLGGEPLPGAVEAIGLLRQSGEAIAFVTNHSQHRRGDIAQRLAGIGVDAGNDVISSAMAVSALVARGERVFPFAGPGVIEALEASEVEVLPDGNGADAVVVGRHEDLSWERLTSAARAVRSGARFIATNLDPSYPTARGVEPGTGAIVAAVEVAAGRPVDAVAGKPHEAIASIVRAHLGDSGWVIGDMPSTDGALATQLGWGFSLVVSAATPRLDRSGDREPDLTSGSLLEAVTALLGGERLLEGPAH